MFIVSILCTRQTCLRLLISPNVTHTSTSNTYQLKHTWRALKDKECLLFYLEQKTNLSIIMSSDASWETNTSHLCLATILCQFTKNMFALIVYSVFDALVSTRPFTVRDIEKTRGIKPCTAVRMQDWQVCFVWTLAKKIVCAGYCNLTVYGNTKITSE